MQSCQHDCITLQREIRVTFKILIITRSIAPHIIMEGYRQKAGVFQQLYYLAPNLNAPGIPL